MPNRIEVTEAVIKDNRVQLYTNLEDNIQLEATGQMLVDSDNLAFIYILENDGYIYVSLQEGSWPQLKDALDKEMSVFIHIKDNKVELTGLQDELLYLVKNIQGNPNYGDEMVEKVEKIFL